ncbi:MAG TPA: transglutaminase family protein [Pirellulales bacterium]|nr:transglutaminase family protein [Pirellulales bacterium]
MNTSDVLAKMGLDAPLPMIAERTLYGLWFQMMAPVTDWPDEEMAKQDIAQLNMQSALGIPGTERLTLEVIEGYVRKLDDWAEQVRRFTEKHQNKFTRRPWEYNNSRGQFSILCLATYINKHLGMHYNKAFSQGEYDASDSRNLLLHGLLSGHGGTCATLPILYIAIGRRLGYPLRLVHAKMHSFVRWDGPSGERFNIEATSPGFNPRPDSHYREWPEPISDEEFEKGAFLRSLGPREELAHALCQRTMGMIAHLKLGDALLSCFLAARLAPDVPGVQGNWSVATVMAHALETARKQTGLKNYDGIDLRRIPIAEPKPPMLPSVAEHVRDDLCRIARNREKARAAAPCYSGRSQFARIRI